MKSCASIEISVLWFTNQHSDTPSSTFSSHIIFGSPTVLTVVGGVLSTMKQISSMKVILPQLPARSFAWNLMQCFPSSRVVRLIVAFVYSHSSSKLPSVADMYNPAPFGRRSH